MIFPPIRVWDRPRNFPTGLGLIAARLRQAGYKVGVVDANGLRLSDDEVIERVRRLNPAVIGIGGLITTYAWVKRMSPRLRAEFPQARVILGGSVAASIVETALSNLAVDLLVVGEGDDTIMELLPALLNNQSLDKIAGLAYRENCGLRIADCGFFNPKSKIQNLKSVIRTPERPLIDNLDALPYPAWDLFPMDVYLENPIVGVGRDIDIISSRGCPFPCGYCYRIFGRQYRGRSAEHVVGEMEALKRDYDVDFISFQDDCFVIDKKRVFAICDLIDRSPILRGIRWSCTGRVTVCEPDLLQRMRASGCVSVSYGIESGSETILGNMKKSVDLEQSRAAIRNTRAAGLRCPVSFMIGYPGETRATVMQTVEFCREMNIPLSALMFTCPYPGTPLYEDLRASGQIRQQDEEALVLKMGDAVDLTINLTEMSDAELIALRAEALELAKKNYTPPTAAEVEAQERALYGEELYRKAQQQLQSPAMQAHRARHGFNEAIKK